jgi:hypothetical protein
MPSYMVPAVVILLQEFPRLPSGKIDRASLPPIDATLESRVGLGPATPLERAIAALWSEALSLKRIDAAGTFFDHGGNSLLAVAVAEKMRSTLGLPVQPQDLVMQSLGQLARTCEGRMTTGKASPLSWRRRLATAIKGWWSRGRNPRQ